MAYTAPRPGRVASAPRRSPPAPNLDRQEAALQTMHGRGRLPVAASQVRGQMPALCKSVGYSRRTDGRALPGIGAAWLIFA